MKTRFLIPILLLVVLAAVSCNKEQDSPAIEITPGDYVVLSASIGAPDTKIHFEKDMGSYTETKWQDGDCLWVRSSTQPYWERGDCFKTSVAQISTDGHKADFVGRTRADGKLAAVYPYSRVLQDSDNETISVELPQNRALKAGDCPDESLIAAAFWADGSKSFTMQHLMGAIKFSITGEGEKVSSFVLIDADTNNSLWGTMTITPDYEKKTGTESVSNNSTGRNLISLDADVTLGATPLEFYFAVPGGSFSKGFVLKAYGSDGKMLASVMSQQANTVECGKVVKMPAVKMEPAAGGQAFEGSGIEADPYIVATADNLVFLSNALSSDEYEKYADKYYRQTENIDMSGLEFKPIGELKRPFKGTYDGNEKSISNLSTSGFNADNPASGVFGYAEGARLKGITVKNRVNTGSFNRVGGVVGYAKNCEIEACVISGGVLEAANNMCGGIVADMSGGTISACSAENVKIINRKNYAGGIVAYAHDGVEISICGIIDGTEVSAPNEVGGIVGKAEGGSIQFCVANKVKVTAGDEDAGAIGGWVTGDCEINAPLVSTCEVSAVNYAGGVIGLLEKSTISGAVVTESNISTSKNCAGGVAGYLKKAAMSYLNDCSVSSNTLVSGVANIGGLAGWVDTGTLLNCSLSASRVIASGDGVGGLVGRAISKSGTLNLINNCKISDDALVKGAYSVGGLVGYVYPDAGGILEILNSGITGVTIQATACDTGGDPAKGDSMCGGICGWMRLKDAGSKAYIVNCYSYPKDAGFICDLPMAHPSFGGFTGYASVSSTGALEILNCASSVQKKDFIVNGSVIADVSASAQVGSLFGIMPNSAVIKVSSCHYIDQGEGGLGIGVSGANVVVSGNFPHSDSVFNDGTTMVAQLNEYVSGNTQYELKTWVIQGNRPFPGE